MSIDHYTCPFSHLILSGRCGCQYSAKDCIAEKEFGACLNEHCSTDCQSLYHHLRENSDFALKAHHQSSLSVGQQSKIKMGGLLALQEILTDLDTEDINNIVTLVALTKQTYNGFEKIPFSQLMPKISKFKFRNRP